MRVAIIGAGMAGLACADVLAAAGHDVALFDKGRGAGGRMSTRRWQTPLGAVTIDHGAQYFTVRDPDFARLVNAWHDAGIATPWPPAGRDAWVGVAGMNAVVKQMAGRHSVSWGYLVKSVLRRAGGWHLMGEGDPAGPFEALVLAIPAEQAAPILSLHDLRLTGIALRARSQPCWTGMFVFDRRIDGLPTVVRDHGEIAWAARNSDKPGRPQPECWVVQATAGWSDLHIEERAETVADHLLDALSHLAGAPLPPVAAASAHRWRYALSAGTGDGALWNAELQLGVCGDWLLGPRVECAWLSGTQLGRLGLGMAAPGGAAMRLANGSDAPGYAA